MNLENISSTHSFNPYFNNEGQCSLMSEELHLKIFSYLDKDLSTRGKICCVSKKWKRLANDSILWKQVILTDSKITDQRLHHLKLLTQLESLNLSKCNNITDQGLRHLKSFTQLKSLNLSGCNNITNQGLSCLENLVLLQELDISYCNQIRTQSLNRLQSLPHLKKLHLKGFDNIPKEVLEIFEAREISVNK